MTITSRDRRALLLLGFVAIGVLLYILITNAAGDEENVSPKEAIAVAEQRLERMRQIAAQVPARTLTHQEIRTQLAQREKRVLRAETGPQAQAQLLQIVNRVARSQTPPVIARNSEFSPIRTIGDTYGEVPVSVNMECAIDQLLNVITELTAQPELIAVQELRVYSANPKQKTVNVRLTVSAVVPKELAPKRGGSTL